MSKKCARCEKTVYPIEELKCLDKIWHKQCFKCQVCNMTLNMRNYKGYDKQPYCEAHIPKVKATTMAETPELKRIAENTKIQSNVLYHAEFEKAKGKFTQVADDPETLRIKQNSKIISNVAYHGELEKKAAMEKQRLMKGENGEKASSEDGEDSADRHLTQLEDLLPPPSHPQPHVPVAATQPPPQPQQPQQPPVQYQAIAPVLYTQVPAAAAAAAAAASAAHQPGKISDYDPLCEQPRNSPYSARQSATLIYTSDRGPVTTPPSRQVGSIADLDPVNNYYGSLSADFRALPTAGHFVNNNHAAQQPMAQNHAAAAPSSGRKYRALYDYDAQDEDEVSFRDGDLIVNCTAIDEGWMTGLVQRTGRTGMLPANYVEPAN